MQDIIWSPIKQFHYYDQELIVNISIRHTFLQLSKDWKGTVENVQDCMKKIKRTTKYMGFFAVVRPLSNA